MLAAELSESLVVMAAMMFVRLLVCLSESGSSLSQPGALLVAMVVWEMGAMQEQVAGRVLRVAHQHQSYLGQSEVTMFRVLPDLEQRGRGYELSQMQQ